jgi:outer membrane protein
MTSSYRIGLQVLRQSIALSLCCAVTVSSVWAQGYQQKASPISPQKPRSNILVRPYQAPFVPGIRTGNSPRLQDLIRAGNLYLTVQDAIALALENNIDLEIARYNPLLNEWSWERAAAGGALPGVPTASSQINSNVNGAGVSGSQQAAGVNTGNNGGGNASNNTTITQIGPQVVTLDPAFQQSDAFIHSSSPQPNSVASQVYNYIQNKRVYSGSLTEGIISGGQVSVSYTNQYLNENAPTDLLNPIVTPVAQISFQHNLLSGFGVALNSRNITVAKNNYETSDLPFKATVISTVTNVLNLYYALVADYQDLKAKQSAVEVAQRFYQDNKKQVEIGTMAPIDVTTAEAQLATSQQDLVVSQTTLQQGELQLKNVLSRRGLADPLLADVHVIPLDRIVVSDKDDLPPLKELTAMALKNGPSFAVTENNLKNTAITATGTQNGVLPQFGVFGSIQTQGLAGVPQTVVLDGQTLRPDPYFVGGMGNALGQMFRRNFPTQNIGVFYGALLRNRTAQADEAIDQLQLRQGQLQDQKARNQAAVDVSNQVTQLQQARVRYQAATHSRVLQEQLLDAEQKKFKLGASTTLLVVTQQRDLATAQSNEVAALISYSNARTQLYSVLGTTLDEMHVSFEDAKAGRVAKPSTLPDKLPQQP